MDQLALVALALVGLNVTLAMPSELTCKLIPVTGMPGGN
nr:MAG TPA: hypothetical protein [Caudoviricetes sp.]